MSGLALIVCPECHGTGNADDAALACEVCLGQCHIATDRCINGDIPVGATEWVPPLLPDTPHNPLVPLHSLYPRCIP